MASRLPSVRQPAGSGRAGRPLSMFEVPADHMKRLQKMGDGGRNSPTDSLLSAEGTTTATTKQSKRRSFLPQFSSRKSSVEEKGSTVASIQEDASESDSGSASASVPEPEPEPAPTRTAMDARRAMPPPPKPRTSSMRPPTTTTTTATSTMPPTRTAPSHAKTASRDGNMIPARTSSQNHTPPSTTATHTSGLKRTASTRLPQSPGPRPSSRHAIAPRTSSVNANKTSPPAAHQRSSVSSVKAPAQNTVAPPPTRSQPSPTSPTRNATTATSRPTTRSQLPPSSKPSFSTYQQHYSPAKTSLPKPPLPTAKTTKSSAPAQEEEAPMTFELALEQIELLQLSILHQDSTSTLSEYEASAKDQLGRIHAKLQKDYETIRTHEQEQRQLANLTALESWCPDPALLAEQLQILNRVVSDLRAHTESGSRYSEMIDTFETWANKAEIILMSDRPTATFIEALPESWRATHTSLALKIRSIQRDISILPPPPPSNDSDEPSSLEVMLDNCVLLVDGMLKELEIMTKVQKEVLQRGKARIDEQINALVSAGAGTRGGGGEMEKENWQPAWLSVA